jgi:putative ABC transport system substrate-binding protein
MMMRAREREPMDCCRSRPSRRRFVLGAGIVGTSLLAGCGRLPWLAQEPAKVHRIGCLLHYSANDPSRRFEQESFRQALRELGYVEGQNLIIETRWTEGRVELLPPLAAELVDLPVEIILTQGDAALSTVTQATTSIPIVVAVIGDLVEVGYAASLARPGGNVTGLTDMSPSLSSKRLELLKDTVPGVARVGVLWNPNNRVKVLDFAQTRSAAEALGMGVQSLVVREPGDFDGAFEAAAREQIDALVPLGEPLVNSRRVPIVEFAARSRIPAIYQFRDFVTAGGLMSYGVTLGAQWRRTAAYVDRILKGAKPADLPIEQPMTFEFVVNLKTAQALGITFPNEIMLQVTDVIQ